MLNIAIQGLTLLSGLLVNFVVPALFGLEAYGVFIQTNILVFVFQKVADIVNEPLISHLEKIYIFGFSLLMAGVVMLIFMILIFFQVKGSPILLFAMLLSSCCLLSMYALSQQVRILLYLIVFLAVFFSLLGLRLFEIFSLSIESILILTNLIPASMAACGLLFSGARIPPCDELIRMLGSISNILPRLFSVTLVFNLLTNILPLVFSRTLPAKDLGVLRVMTSVIQAATSLFPLNTKAIFVAFVDAQKRDQIFYGLMTFSLLYFSVLQLAGFGAVWLWPTLKPYLVLLPLLPVLYWTVLVERYGLACRQGKIISLVNLLVGGVILIAALFGNDLRYAEMTYAIGFSLYLLMLSRFVSINLNKYVLFWLVIVSPVLLLMQAFSPWLPVLSAFLLIFVSIRILGFDFKSLRNVGF